MACNPFTVQAVTQAVTATPKSILGFKPATNVACKALRLDVTLDGADATKGPALIEICHCTWATQGTMGTNNTAVTPAKKDTTRAETLQVVAGRAWTTEPTVLTVVDSFNVPSYMGVVLGYKIDLPISGGAGIVIRVTSSAINCNVTLTLHGEE